MLEQLARDVTGWPARAVEFFEAAATTRYMNHIRSKAAACGPARRHPARDVGTFQNGAFDTFAHTAEMRRVGSRSGRCNIPNIGIFLWRVQALKLGQVPLVAAGWIRAGSGSTRSAPTSRCTASRGRRKTSPTSRSRSTYRCRCRAAGSAPPADYYGPGRLPAARDRGGKRDGPRRRVGDPDLRPLDDPASPERGPMNRSPPLRMSRSIRSWAGWPTRQGPRRARCVWLRSITGRPRNRRRRIRPGGLTPRCPHDRSRRRRRGAWTGARNRRRRRRG